MVSRVREAVRAGFTSRSSQATSWLSSRPGASPATEATANAAHANPTRSGAYQALPATSTRAPRTYRRTASDAATPRDWNIICWRSFIPSGFFMIFLWRYNSMAFAPPEAPGAAALKCISLAMHPLRQCSFKMRARGHQRGGHDHAGCIY